MFRLNIREYPGTNSKHSGRVENGGKYRWCRVIKFMMNIRIRVAHKVLVERFKFEPKGICPVRTCIVNEAQSNVKEQGQVRIKGLS